MKVAHSTVITPNRCGLYETTRELVTALRTQGIDSRLVDPLPDSNPEPDRVPIGEDRGAMISDLSFVSEADILVSHSGLGDALEKTGKPVVHVAHGRPYHSFLSEAEESGAAIYSHHYASNKKKHYKAIVTFWPEHVPYLEVMYPDKPVHCVQSSVDLEAWSPGDKKYNFQGKGGGVNIVCTDANRNDIDLYKTVNAYALWARENKHLDPKLHIFNRPKSLKGWTPLIKQIQDEGNMGMLVGWSTGLKHIYRAADCVLTPHEIDVRTVREAMACGCPVARICDILTDTIDYALQENRNLVRLKAERSFNPATTARQFGDVLNDVMH